MSASARVGHGPTADGRLIGLDGIRGLAALYVVLHHCWLLSYPGFPDNTGPAWSAFFIYGHLAVGIFIVLSGFSLAVSPARRRWQVGDLGTFAQRRAWRILPPYWPALLFSLIIAWTIAAQPGEGRPTFKSVLVFGLLIQDVVGAPTPNGAFWSIAVEAQLYLLFPVLILVLRRFGSAVMVAGVAATVLVIGLLAPHVEIVDKLMRFTPQFAVLFSIGIAAAGIVVARETVQRLPWPALSLLAIAPVAAAIGFRGSQWAVPNYFWIDLAIGPAIGLFLVGIATRRPPVVVQVLDTGPVRALGSCSYSLYLIHAPIVVVVHERLVAPRTGVSGFLITLGIAVPASLLAARIFAAVFEIPFTRHRTVRDLRAAARSRRTTFDTVGAQ